MSSTQDLEKFQAVHVTAARLGVPAAWLRAEIEAGRIPYLKAGRQILLHTDTVRNVLLERANAELQANAHRGPAEDSHFSNRRLGRLDKSQTI